jgi:hypothetical protein
MSRPKHRPYVNDLQGNIRRFESSRGNNTLALATVPARTSQPTPLIQPLPPPELKIENAFLNEWVEYHSKFTDAPKIFLLFSGIAVLSAILNKHYFEYPRRTQLNLYILILAASTIDRKSTCTDFAKDYLRMVNPGLLFPDSFTVEASYDIFKKHPKGIVVWPELSQVKEFMMGQSYNRALPSFLTDIYDSKPTLSRWTVGKGEIESLNPVLSIFAAGVGSWFTKNLHEVDFQGGIWTRFLLVPTSESEKPFSLPKAFTPDKGILHRLRKMDKNPEGRIDWSNIEAQIKDWGTRHRMETKKLGDSLLSAIFHRYEVMAIKLAAIFQIAQDGKKVLSPEAFRDAVTVIEYLKAVLPSFFQDEVKFNPYDKDLAKTRNYLKKHGPETKAHILQGTGIRKKILDEVLKQLREMGEISEKPTQPKGHIYTYIAGTHPE